ncbi:MAG: type I-B CRISPR-associated protein Cas7/Cst2/DevR [Ktedonobacterales bacterium]
MPFATGLLVIDASASALNNLGNIPGDREDNSVGVKNIRTKEGYFPYVSAQAFRYWHRMTLQAQIADWKAAPIYREEKIAYTDSNPIIYWDDDLFGYMRAPSKRESARTKREADTSRVNETETTSTITRAAPFRVSTLVSVAPVSITNDFGTMSRHEGNPVPHEHQFYRASLRGLFSLDLHASGTFSYRDKTGFRNLDDERVKQAIERRLEHLEVEKSYRLPLAERVQRIQALFEGLARLEGGAKQTLHYTDVAPSLVILAITRGGNHIFNYVVGANAQGKLEMKLEAWQETLRVFASELLSDVYIGWTQGYLDDVRKEFMGVVNQHNAAGGRRILVAHPREVFAAFGRALAESSNAASWLA